MDTFPPEVRLAVVTTAVLTAFTLAGCGGHDDSDTSPPDAQQLAASCTALASKSASSAFPVSGTNVLSSVVVPATARPRNNVRWTARSPPPWGRRPKLCRPLSPAPSDHRVERPLLYGRRRHRRKASRRIRWWPAQQTRAISILRHAVALFVLIRSNPGIKGSAISTMRRTSPAAKGIKGPATLLFRKKANHQQDEEQLKIRREEPELSMRHSRLILKVSWKE